MIIETGYRASIERWGLPVTSQPFTITAHAALTQYTCRKTMTTTRKNTDANYRPVMSDEGLDPTHPVSARDEFGNSRDLNIAGEFPLTIKVDNAEVVTLMT